MNWKTILAAGAILFSSTLYAQTPDDKTPANEGVFDGLFSASQTQARHSQLQNIVPDQTLGQRVGPGEVPAGLSNGDWASIQTQIAEGKYRAHKHENDGFVSSNPAHGWQVHYTADGTTELRPHDGEAQAYHLGLKLSAFGFAGLQSLDHPQKITADNFTVTYQWNNDLREWWVNSETGLEQWFELEQRPPDAHSGQPLTLEMTLQTNLAASQHGDTLSFVNDAGTTISYNKLKAWDAGGRELPARMQLLANHLSLIIDDSDARYPLTIDPSFQQQAYLKASNTGSVDEFGWSVAISGDTVVVGVVGEDSNATGVNGADNNSAGNSGAAYVFTRSGTVWNQQAYLKASNTGSGDQFGFSVAIAGDTLVVGANAEDSNATGINGDQTDNSSSLSGAAYVFARSGTTWSQQAYLKASNTGSSDQFGWSVAIAGDTLVVSAVDEGSSATGINGDQGNNLATLSGAVYVFTRSGTTWSQQAYLKASNTGSTDQFGHSAAISDDTLVVGAYQEDSNATGINGDQTDNSATQAGAAYVFTRSGTTWSQQAYLKASNTGSGDQFARSVAIAGDTLVVGARYEDSNTTGINGDQGNNSATQAGAAYIFTRSGTVWSQQAYLKASNTGSGDDFGWSVAIAGDTVVVGARYEDSNATGINGDQTDNSASLAGAAYVFTHSGTTWSQQAYLKASNTGSYDYFGYSVAIAGDTLVVGAVGEDSNATGINGNQSNNSAGSAGAAYVFDIDYLAIASFQVIKDFSDDNPLPVEVQISCNTGLPMNADTTISDDGDPDGGVNFVVTSFTSGELDCTVTEAAVAGYAAEYENVSVPEISDVACTYTAVNFEAEHSCVITNQVLPVSVDVTKQWITPGTGGDLIDQVASIIVFSPTSIEGGNACHNSEINEDGYCKSLDFEGPQADTQSVAVLPHFEGVTVLVDEQLFNDAIETVNECGGSVQILPAQGASCTITNTVFFESIPTLSQYGLAVLALLMLGVGLVGYRRFA